MKANKRANLEPSEIEATPDHGHRRQVPSGQSLKPAESQLANLNPVEISDQANRAKAAPTGIMIYETAIRMVLRVFRVAENRQAD